MGRSTAKYRLINGLTNNSLPDVRLVKATLPNSPRSAAAIWPCTMLGRRGVTAWAWRTASRYASPSGLRGGIENAPQVAAVAFERREVLQHVGAEAAGLDLGTEGVQIGPWSTAPLADVDGICPSRAVVITVQTAEAAPESHGAASDLRSGHWQLVTAAATFTVRHGILNLVG